MLWRSVLVIYARRQHAATAAVAPRAAGRCVFIVTEKKKQVQNKRVLVVYKQRVL